MFSDPDVDAVIIATPSFSHFELAKAALEAGKHALVEKPIALASADARELVKIAKDCGKICAVMLNQRTTPIYARIRELVASGELGRVNRASWFMTNWYRPQIYFSSSPWRGTWKGEAGGALINQSIHNIDIFTWIFGLPDTLRAWCKFGQVPRHRSRGRGDRLHGIRRRHDGHFRDVHGRVPRFQPLRNRLRQGAFCARKTASFSSRALKAWPTIR